MALPPTRPTLRRRYNAKRERLIDSAAALFANQGYHATTIGEITAATGLTAGGLYHYIGSKEQLLIAICDRLMEPLLRNVEALELDRLDGETALHALVATWVDHVAAHRHHMAVFVQERQLIEREPQWRHIAASRKRFEQLLDATLQQVERDRGIPFDDRRLTAFALLGMVNHLPQWHRPRGRLRTEQIATGFCTMVLGTSAG